MLHPLARIEINKLEAHGITDLSYDEVAALQMAAVAVDEAVKSEGLPVGLPRPVRLTQDIVLYPLTLAASAAFDTVMPWLAKANETLAAMSLAWLMAHGRDLDLLRSTCTDRRTFLRTVKAWGKRLPVTAGEFASAVDAVFDVEAGGQYLVDVQSFDSVARFAEAAGAPAIAAGVKGLKQRLVASRKKTMQKHVARPSWGTLTLRLAALTGCPPDAWAVQPTTEALDAYAARIDFAALSAGALAGGGSKTASDPAERAQISALRDLFATTDAIARAHKGDAKR